MKSFNCKYCNTRISYESSANFIVFCPNCKKTVFIECEYGYGPVTPCQILLGDKKIGTVNTNDSHEYYLDYESEIILLKETYLEALKEASEVVKERIRTQNDNIE